MNRRDFIKSTLLSVAGLVVAPSMILPETTTVEASALRIQDPGLRFLPLEKRSLTDSIILHHIGSTNADVSAETIHQWHLANGWSGIGYHFVVHKNGSVERGRPQNSVGAHCWQHNRTSIGINIVGDFESAEPTVEQLDAASLLMSQLVRYYRIQPMQIKGHRDFNETLCPGSNLYAKLPNLREKVASLAKVSSWKMPKAEEEIQEQTPERSASPTKRGKSDKKGELFDFKRRRRTQEESVHTEEMRRR